MENKKIVNTNLGIFLILIFVVICTVVDFIVIGWFIRDDSVDNQVSTEESNKSIIENKPVDNDVDNMVDDSTMSMVVSVIEDYYVEIFISHSSKYCGEVDVDDAADEIYYRNKIFNSISSIASHFSSIVSNNYFENNLEKMYVEDNGNLYCKMNQVASLEYENNSFSISSIIKSNNIITVQGSYRTLESDLNPSESFNAVITLVNVDGSWVIDSYEEVK